MAQRKRKNQQHRDTGAGKPARRPRTAGRRLPLWKKAVLAAVVTVGFFVLLELALRTLGVRPRPYGDDPYVGFTSEAPLFVERDGMMVRAANKSRLFNEQEFPAAKGADTVRVFCVGGSTTYGRPYDSDTSYCGWLGRFLPAADPSRQWEVVNAGGISYASYRVAVLMEELIGYEPDLFIVYTGHNEFLERRTYPQIIATPRAVRGLGTVLSRTSTWAALERVVDSAREPAPTAPATRLGDDVKTLLDDAVGPSAYTRDDELGEKIVQHFTFNLSRMVDIADSAGARIIMVTPASNLRTCRPFKSENRDGLDQASLTRWQTLTTMARIASTADQAPEELGLVEQALQIDGRHALVHFRHGELLDTLGRHDEARDAYLRARDEDVCTLRATTEIEQAVRTVAAERQVPLVDFVALAAAEAEHGIPGRDLFYDHVHPTISTHRRLAVALLEQMQALGLVDPQPSWGEQAITAIAAEVEAGLDPTAHGLALMNLSKVLGWAGKLREANELAQEAVERAPDDTGVQYQAGLTANLVGDLDRAVLHYRRAVELEPDNGLAHGNLGVVLEQRMETEQAAFHLRRAVALSTGPDLVRNTANLARVLDRLGYETYQQRRFADAARILAEADQLAPNNAGTLDRLAVALLASNQMEAALGHFRRSLELEPRAASVRSRYAVALASSGQLDEAERQFLQAIRGDTSLLGARDGLLVLLERRGQLERAARLRARAAEIIASVQTRDGAS
jgi:tetratricopeptide (TPR) repeat protein